jgi:PilZ domain
VRWFVKENRRSAPRHRHDGADTWIRLGGSLVRQCQVLDLSRTGVRLTVPDAGSLPDTFTLILSKNSAGRPARVRWRRGNEVGAEFFTPHSSSASRSAADAANPSSSSRLKPKALGTNSSRASRLAVDAPGAAKPLAVEAQKFESRWSTLRSQAQDQSHDVPHLKADAPKVACSSSNDQAKAEADLQITDRNEQVDRADQKKTGKKTIDLSRLQKKLGPDHVALIDALKYIDPESPHGRELASIIERLEETP